MSQVEKVARASRSESFRKLNPDIFINTAAPEVTAHAMLQAIKDNENHHSRTLPDAVAECHQAAALGGPAKGEAQGIRRTRVRFTGFRRKPLDPDNFAGGVKDLLDGLRRSGLISGDEWWRIKLETEQVKVATEAEEKTVIEIIP